MKDIATLEKELLEGMPSAKRPHKVVKRRKFVPTQNVPVDTSVRRQVAEEIGEAEPTRDQKYILLQKYGVVAARIDRQVVRPKWMGVTEWKRKLNDWLKSTKGLVPATQQKRYPRPFQPANGNQRRENSKLQQRSTQRKYPLSPNPGNRNRTTVNSPRSFDRTRTGNSHR